MFAKRTKKQPLLSDRREQAKLCKEYYLFLLELFVKKASGDRLAKLNKMFFVPTTVYFEFLDFVDENDLKVTPIDTLFQPQAGIANDVEVFDAGKSVLFAVDHNAMKDRTVKMILKLIVKKEMPNGIEPDILVGTGKLNLSDRYAALRLEMLQNWKSSVTLSKVYDGQVSLIHNESLSGNLDIFVRLSGFGQTIVTEFNTPTAQDPTTFVFGDGRIDQISSYKFREVGHCDVDLLEDTIEDLRSPAACPVCVPERYPCVPCGRLAAVEDKDDEMKQKLNDMSWNGPAQPNHDLSQSNDRSVVFKISGLFENGDGNGEKKPTVTVAGEPTKPGDPPDPDHDIFVLRIGKKGLVGVGEKSDIQLEMKTPKGLERRPPIRYETRDMQTDENDEEEPLKDKKKKKKKK